VTEVDVIGSARRGVGVEALVARVRAALAAAGVTVAPDGAPGEESRHPIVAVDPAAWFAERVDAGTTPGPELLARVVGLSTAVPDTPLFDDEAALGKHLAAVLHHDPRVVADFVRRGCRASVLPYGVLPRSTDPGAERPIDVATAGPDCERRNRVLAHGAPWFATVRCHHRLDRDLRVDADPFTSAKVVLDVLTGDRLPPDPLTVLGAVEAGAALVVEQRGELLREDLVPSVLCSDQGTGFAVARDLAQDPTRAEALARSAYDELLAAHPLETMGAVLVEAAATARSPRPVTHDPVDLHRAWEVVAEPVADQLQRMKEREDAPVREGLREVLQSLRGVDARLRRLEAGGPPPADEVLRRSAADAGAEPPQVSVLVPAYRAAGWVLEAVASVRENAREPWPLRFEAIVVDDASPTDDGKLVAAWAAEHPDLPVTIVRHGANRGLAAARNTALAHARAPFVLPLDADNALLEGGAKRLFLALHDDTEAAFAYGILQERTVKGPSGLRNAVPWSRERLRQGNFVDALAMVRTEVLRAAGGYTAGMPEQGYEDWDLWCRLATAGHHGMYVPEMVATYRVRPNSMSEQLHLSHVGPLADMLERHPDLLA